MDNRFAFLKTVSPFNLLPDDVLLGVENLLQEVRYTKETLIYQQDTSKLRGLDIVVQGAYETFFYDSEQNKRLPETYGVGACYGGMSILLNKKRSIRTVIARKTRWCMRCPAATFGRSAWPTKTFFTTSRRATASGCSTRNTRIL